MSDGFCRDEAVAEVLFRPLPDALQHGAHLTGPEADGRPAALLIDLVFDMNPHKVTQDFEHALCEYTGAPYAVAVNSCTMALLLAVAWHLRREATTEYVEELGLYVRREMPPVEIPKRTYVSVPMSIIHAGGRPTFRDEEWTGSYQLRPYPIIDSARWFTSGLFDLLAPAISPMSRSAFVCVSFHWAKTLGIQQGGAILHDDPKADPWLRRARFDGRTEGVSPAAQAAISGFSEIGWHAYMSPEIAAEGLVRLSFLPKHNAPLPNDDYPDLSTLEIFR